MSSSEAPLPAETGALMRTLRAVGVRLRLQDGRWRVAGDSASGTDAQQAAAELLASRAAEADVVLDRDLRVLHLAFLGRGRAAAS